jgi:hypothetical protein
VTDVGKAAVRQHGGQLLAVAALFGAVFDVVQLFANRIGRIRLDGGRVDPLVFPNHRTDMRGQEDRHVDVLLGHGIATDGLHPFLVVGIRIGVQKAYRDPVDLLFQ